MRTAQSNLAGIGPEFVPSVAPSMSAEYFTDDEFTVVAYDSVCGAVRRLEPAASAVWSLIDGEATAGQIAADLADMFSLSPSGAFDDVRAVIQELQSLGMVEGEMSALLRDSRSQGISPRVLPHVVDPETPELSRLDWMPNFHLQLGNWFLGIRPDTEQTASMLRTLFAAYIEDSRTVELSNFSIRRPGNRLRPRPGALYIGGLLAARSNSIADLVYTLAGFASGLDSRAEGVASTDLRVFVRDGQAVLIDAPRPQLVADGALPDRVAEVPLWKPQIEAQEATILLSAPLENLCWIEAGIPAPATDRDSYPIAGVVVQRQQEDIAGIREVWRASSGHVRGWRELLGHMHESGRTRTAITQVEYGAAIEELLNSSS